MLAVLFDFNVKQELDGPKEATALEIEAHNDVYRGQGSPYRWVWEKSLTPEFIETMTELVVPQDDHPAG